MNIDELEGQFAVTSQKLGVTEDDQQQILAFLAPLREGTEAIRAHYAHSLRVGQSAQNIATFVNMEAKPLFFAGTLHDVGKCEIPADVLGKTENWTEADALVMEEHVMAGYRLLKHRFHFSAEIILWHHKFQERGYPKVLPPPLHEYKERTRAMIVQCGRLLALADVYDALHRSNDRFGGSLSGVHIQELMYQYNPDCTLLIRDLYEASIFST